MKKYVVIIVIVTAIILVAKGISNRFSNTKITTNQFISKFDKLISKNPVNVGFDIDSTVLFSEPCFYKYKNEYIEKYKLQGTTTKQQMAVIFKQQSFWDNIAQCDVYSLPKVSALKIIRMHQKRGDKVFFITARIKPNDKYINILNDYLIKVVGSSKNLQKVMYATDKTKLIKDNNISVFYGDSDSDIEFAKNASAKGIRFVRSSLDLQYYSEGYNVGKFKELILTDSSY